MVNFILLLLQLVQYFKTQAYYNIETKVLCCLNVMKQIIIIAQSYIIYNKIVMFPTHYNFYQESLLQYHLQSRSVQH